MDDSSNLVIDFERAQDQVDSGPSSPSSDRILEPVQLLVGDLDCHRAHERGGDSTGLSQFPGVGPGGAGVRDGAVER